MKTLLIILFGLAFTSCMHFGMMGVGNSHHAGGTHVVTSGPVLEKEVTAGDVKAIALFPSLDYGRDVTLTVKLMDAHTSAPISDAQVYFEAQYADPVARDHDNASPHRAQQSVVESSVAGVYTIPYGTVQPGKHRLIFHITAIGKRELEPGIVVEATRVLSDGNMEHKGDMMGGAGYSPLVIAGAAVIGAVMVSMLVGHRGMF